MHSVHQGFQVRGQSADDGATFRWLDRADGHPLAREVKQHMLEMCPVRPRDEVLDVGCGLGHEVMRLAERVGPGGRAVGIDANPSMVAEAQRRAAALTFPIEFDLGDAHDLDFPDGVFDLCRTERVLRYLEAPDRVLQEMARVVRPGGNVVAFDFDSDQTVVDAPDSTLARRIAQVLDAAVPHPWVGRQLSRLFQNVGLVDVRVVPHVVVLTGAGGFAMYEQLGRGTIARAVDAGQITSDHAATWWEGLEQAAAEGTFFWANLGFIAQGRKP